MNMSVCVPLRAGVQWACVPRDGYLLRPLNRPGTAFQAGPLSADEICKRLQTTPAQTCPALPGASAR